MDLGRQVIRADRSHLQDGFLNIRPLDDGLPTILKLGGVYRERLPGVMLHLHERRNSLLGICEPRLEQVRGVVQPIGTHETTLVGAQGIRAMLAEKLQLPLDLCRIVELRRAVEGPRALPWPVRDHCIDLPG